MAKGWKCPHCSTENAESTLTCSGCGRIQGSVVVPGSPPVQPVAPPPTDPSGYHGAPLWNPTGSATGTPAAPGSPAAPGTPAAPGSEAGPTEPGWTVNLDAVPPASKPIWQRLPVGWLIVGALVVAGGIGGLIFNAGRSSTGEIDRSGDLTANDLRLGDCFDLKDPEAEEVLDVTAHPCTETHEYEVFFVGNMTAGAYPSDDTVTTFVVDNCGPAFASYVGLAYADSKLDFSWLSPTSGSWSDGDRSVQCAAYDPDNARLTTSVRGSAR